MGKIIKANSVSNTVGLLRPIIYCYSDKELLSKSVSVNVLLANELVKIKESSRTMQIEKIFEQIIGAMPDGVIIRDFDVLFNPAYKIDLLNMFCNICRKKDFSILWYGKLSDGVLTYAESEYKDFHSYNIDDYDVTCIIKEI